MARSKKIKDTWQAAVCFNARSIAGLLRESLEELEFEFTREKTERHFTRLLIVMPVPQYAYVFQFKVTKPSQFIINTFDLRPTHAGEVHYIEIQKLNKNNLKDVKTVLKHLADKLPRKPWKIFMAERLRYGLLAPEYLEAKSAWYSMGII
jgi:hypothetical protein